MRRTTAAILTGFGRPLEIAEVELAAPKRDEVLVRMLASGICRSDLSLMKGAWPVPLPMVLGHEGAGVVEAVGPGVDPSRVGERVILTFAPACGRCRFCLNGRVNLCAEAAAGFETGLLRDGTARLSRGGEAVYHLAFVSSFARHAVVPADAAIPVRHDLEPALCCLLGCGVTTGVLSVTKRANVRPGESVAVFGCGGVGLSVIQGARIAGAEKIIAIDTLDAKLQMAKKFGATDTLSAKEDAVKALKKMTGGGPDYAFECVGSGELAGTAYRAIRRGGLAVVVGVAKPSDSTSLRTMTLPFEEKTITGSSFGSCVPRIDFPRMLALYLAGQLKLEELITRRYSIAEAPQAFADLESGRNARGVVVFP